MEIRKSFACAVCVSLILLAAIAVPRSAAAQAPDNPTIAFTANAEGGNIWLMDPDGKNQRPILAIKGKPRTLGFSVVTGRQQARLPYRNQEEH